MIFLRDPSGMRWCRLDVPGPPVGSHITLCGARMDSAEPYVIAGAVDPGRVCAACRAKHEEFSSVWKEPT